MTLIWLSTVARGVSSRLGLAGTPAGAIAHARPGGRRRAVEVPVIATERRDGRLLPLALAVAADHPDRPRTLDGCAPQEALTK